MFDNILEIFKATYYSNLYFPQIRTSFGFDKDYKETNNLFSKFLDEGYYSNFAFNAFFPMILMGSTLLLFLIVRTN